MKKTVLAAAFVLTTSAAIAAAAVPTTSHYQVYSQAAFDAARGKQRVLFFHATWCPTCKAANKDINAHLAEIPDNIVIFKTDYDKEVALKRKYAISYQHTFVLVDDQGNDVSRWAGGGFTELVANVKKANP